MKKIMGSLLISAAVIGIGVKVNAADGVKIDYNSNNIISDATITVEKGAEEPTAPVEPTTPPGETGQNGPLSIDNVIVFNFENMKLKGTIQNISLKHDGTDSKAPRNVQITDTQGTGDGWNLQIKQSDLIDTTTTPGTTKTLKGAYISLANGTVVAAEGNQSEKAPTLNAYDASANKDQFQKLATAEKGAGLGTYLLKYNEGSATEDIQLVVPSGNLVGSYKGTVTWSLSDGPEGKPHT